MSVQQELEIDSTELSIVYEGEILRERCAQADELAELLNSIQELFDAAHDEITTGSNELKIQVDSLHYASLHLNFHVFLQYAGNILDFFGSQRVSGALNLTTTIGIFLAAIKTHKGKVIDKIHSIDKNIALFEIDGKKHTMPSDAFDLYKSLEVRRKAKNFVSVLNSPGFSEIHYVSQTHQVPITKQDLLFFECPDTPEDTLREIETEMLVTISSLAFEGQKKWEVTDGDKTYKARITDKQFLQKVDMNEAFRKNDMLLVVMLTKQWMEKGKLKANYEITKVMSHKPSQSTGQLLLNFSRT
jgi:hypothetical protein